MLAMTAFGNIANAHDETGSLGAPAGATDIWSVNCTTGDKNNARLEVSVTNVTKASPILSVQIKKNGNSQSTSDPVGGDGNYSSVISLSEGDGAYQMILNKAGPGSLKYAIQLHCKTGSGLHTGNDTSSQLIQDDTIAPTQPSNFSFEPTEIKDEAVEATRAFTGVAIGQGCEDDFKSSSPLPVKVVRAVFPNGTGSQAFKIEPNGSETPIALANYIEQANGGVLTLDPGMIQDKNIYKKQFEIVDANGRVRAIEARSGKLDVNAFGIVPFHATAPSFKTGNCAKRLLVRIAVANYCHSTRNTNKDNRADIWIDHVTPLFNDPDVLPHDFVATPYWPTFVVNRDLDSNPLSGSCGEGFDIAVQPSDAEIDGYLPTSGFWPK